MLAALVGSSVALCQSPAPGIYGVGLGGLSPYALYAVSPATGAGTLIGPIYGFTNVNAIAFAPSGVLYGFGSDPLFNPDLITVNPSTGAATKVATITGFPGGSTPNDFAFRSDGVLFASLPSGIYTINTSSGAATLVGAAASPAALAFSGANVLYLADATNLYTVNQSNANLTVVAALAFDPSLGTTPQIRRMKFDPVSGKLYAFVVNAANNNFLALVNSSTAAVSRIGATIQVSGGIAIPASGAVAISVPAISSWGLAILGILLAAIGQALIRPRARGTQA